MAIFFTQKIKNGSDRLQSTPPPPPQQWPPHPPGLNQGMYNIWHGPIFGLPQVISTTKQGNYNLMILKETKIPDAVYCHN